jgi:IS1 family transposase
MANNLPTDDKILVASMLAEGSSIRAIERVTGIHRDTIMRLGVRIGQACAAIHDHKMRRINSTRLEVDEVWGFIGKKKKNLRPFESVMGLGDAWTFIALDSDTKLVPAFRVGTRSMEDASAFIDDLVTRLTNRVQLSTDQLGAYTVHVEKAFGSEVDYAQIVKAYSVVNLAKDAASRYSPANVVHVTKKPMCGTPIDSLISTSFVEKQNHTMRMHCRRLTRLTNAFSKKRDNFKAAVALHFAYYNFCKRHITVKTTPARAAGVEDHEWTVAELVERCGE